MQSIQNTDDLRITNTQKVISPNQLHEDMPLTQTTATTVLTARSKIQSILKGEDDRLVVIVGPCSIHDPKAALEYAHRLHTISPALNENLLIVMRVYFEKPRTTVGWKGLINDPNINNTFDIDKGLHLARQLLLNINNLGIPTATEYLDLITPQYIADLISWGAIGARTTESQCHRELSSGISSPVGFKNATDGSIKIAIDAIRAAKSPHHFLSVTKAGQSAIFSTAGNQDVHIILRGGNDRPNYDSANVEQVSQDLKKANLPQNIMIDFSHANSLKQHQRQLLVADNVSAQIAEGNHSIIGVMIESHLEAGRQDQIAEQPLKYGQSITDACLSWNDTVPLLQKLGQAVQQRRIRKQSGVTL
jgi:3-deoxy-7-phosphoheptulonate synthase